MPLPTPCKVACTLIILMASAYPRAAESSVPFPAGFREWACVKTVLIGREHPLFEQEGGIHHVYANAQAREGLRSGSFPDGSVLVYELLSTEEKNGVVSEGARRRVDMMLKDNARYPDTAGWRFQRYMGDDRGSDVLTPEHRAACFTCHHKVKARDHVFSQFRP